MGCKIYCSGIISVLIETPLKAISYISLINKKIQNFSEDKEELVS